MHHDQGPKARKQVISRRMREVMNKLLLGMDPEGGVNTAQERTGLAQTLQALAKRGWYDSYDKRLTQEGLAKAQELADQLARANARR